MLIPVAVALAGGACETVVAPISVADGCPQQPLRGPAAYADEPGDRLIDDFEDGDSVLAPVASRTGSWILGDDRSSGRITAQASAKCAARGGNAGHFSGVGLTSWGANWTAVFKPATDRAQTYDVMGYSGVSFWAALGGDAPDPPNGVPMGLTTIDVAWNGGVCTTTCMDFYRTDVPLTHAWRRMMIRFDQLAQVGWGLPQVPMRRDQAVGFIIWPAEQLDFDIWIDDVRLEP